jgi:hypothetical protein
MMSCARRRSLNWNLKNLKNLKNWMNCLKSLMTAPELRRRLRAG